MMLDMMSGTTAPTTPVSREDKMRAANKALADEFSELMKKTPIERLRDQYLKAHDLSEDQLAAMSPEERQAVEDDITKYVKDQLNLADLKKQQENQAATGSSPASSLQAMLAAL